MATKPGQSREPCGYHLHMALSGEYAPSPRAMARDQVEAYERSGGREANIGPVSGLPIIIVTARGNNSGKLRKTPLMRVESDGNYALVASRGGAPTHPEWYYNLKRNPRDVTIQDGPEPFEVDVHEAEGSERSSWWDVAIEAYPLYAEYQTRTDRLIPIFVAVPRSPTDPPTLGTLRT
jgi:deazaflavin-dependent oxidoreductase (nitroreductase family)